MSKTNKFKYDPKKDKLNINYDDYKKKQSIENLKDYKNKHNFKFMFYYIPEEITKSIIGIKLTLVVKFISIIYAYRALKSLHEQIETFSLTQTKLDIMNLMFNIICIFTSIMLYFSLYKKSYGFMTFCYYVYMFHFFYKLVETIIYLFQKLSHKRYQITAVIGVILGLSTSSVLNLCCTWIIFSYMVYLYNTRKGDSYIGQYTQ